MRGVPVIIGDARVPQVLMDAGIERAACLVAVADDDELNAAIYLAALDARPQDQPVPAVLRCVDTDVSKLVISGVDDGSSGAGAGWIRIPDTSALIAKKMLESVRLDEASAAHARIAVIGLGKVGFVVVRRLVEEHGIKQDQLTLVDRALEPAELTRLRRIKDFEAIKPQRADLADFLANTRLKEYTHIFVTTGSDLTYLICRNSIKQAGQKAAVRTKAHDQPKTAETDVVAVNTTELIAPVLVEAIFELEKPLPDQGCTPADR